MYNCVCFLCPGNGVYVQASPLVSENEHTRKELEEKRERLERLNHGEASERMLVKTCMSCMCLLKGGGD